MTKQIPIRMTDEDVAAVDAAVASGRFGSRSAVLRRGLELVLGEERERAIEESYRRGYGKEPQEDSVGETGEALFTEHVREEGREGETL